MRRRWWLVALAIVVVGLAAYHWRSNIVGLVGASTTQAAVAATSPAPGTNQRIAQAPAGGAAPAAAGAGTRSGRPGGAAGARGAAGGAGGNNGGGGPGAAGGDQAPFEVATAIATAGALPDQRQTIGWIVANSTNLTSQTTGVVTEIDATAGSDVKKGDVLLKLDPRTAAAAVTKDQAALQRDQATLDQAARAASEATALAQKGADTETSAQQAETAQAVARATIAVDNAQLSADQVALDSTQIRAPFDGRIGAFQIAVGALIQPTTQVVTLTEMAPVDAQFSVSENDLAAVRGAMADGMARVTATPPDATSGVTGALSFLDSTVDKASGTVQARAALANTDLSLWPGESVNVTLDLGARQGLVLVPTVAVVPQGGSSIVYVVKPDHTIDVRTVQVAGSSGEMTGLSSGVQAGEHVVVEGQFNLSSGQRVAEAVAPQPATPSPTAQG